MTLKQDLDQLVFTRMSDPVRLPSSRAIVDRTTIQFHLTLEPRDPFDHELLTEQELIPGEYIRFFRRSSFIHEYSYLSETELKELIVRFANNL